MDAKLMTDWSTDRSFEIWVDKTARIASLHKVQGYQYIAFSSEEDWNQYIDNLIHATYRFQ